MTDTKMVDGKYKFDQASEQEKDDNNCGFASAKFSPGEKVFARETGNLYQAIVRKNALKSEPSHHWVYFVHYLGWNSRWDKWMTEDEIEADTKDARTKAEKAKELARNADLEKKEIKKEREREKKRRKLEKRKIVGSREGKEEKETNDIDNIDINDELTSNCELPLTLKIVLADDHEKVTRSDNLMSQDAEGSSLNTMVSNRLVHILPATIPVRMIITKFVKVTLGELNETITAQEKEEKLETTDASSSTGIISKKERKNHDNVDQNEKLKKWNIFEKDIISLFDETLPKYLLYNQERNQYLRYFSSYDLPKPVSPSESYPGEFLLRMLVRLPILLRASLRDRMMQQDGGPVKLEVLDICKRVKLLIIFLQKNRSSCFKGRYRHVALEEYTTIEKKRYQNRLS